MIAIAAAVAVLMIAITVYSAARDRAREYAPLKVIGLRRRALPRLVSVQAGALAGADTALGVVVIVSHDERLREVADRVLWLEDGRLKALAALVRDPVCGMLLDL
jgi:ABC-type lipoprotein release transport system permease subunit